MERRGGPARWGPQSDEVLPAPGAGTGAHGWGGGPRGSAGDFGPHVFFLVKLPATCCCCCHIKKRRKEEEEKKVVTVPNPKLVLSLLDDKLERYTLRH